MSDASQGPGWWQASDGKWYPPEQAPRTQPARREEAEADPGAAGDPRHRRRAELRLEQVRPVHRPQIIVIVLVIFAVQIVFYGIHQVLVGHVDSFFLGWSLGFARGSRLVPLLPAERRGIPAALAITRGETPESQHTVLSRPGRSVRHRVAAGGGAHLHRLLRLVGRAAWSSRCFTFFYGYFVLDRDQGPTESVGSSFNMVKDNAGTVALLLIVIVLINAFTCGLGAGVTFIAGAYAYKTLNGEPVAA